MTIPRCTPLHSLDHLFIAIASSHQMVAQSADTSERTCQAMDDARRQRDRANVVRAQLTPSSLLAPLSCAEVADLFFSARWHPIEMLYGGVSGR
jgi:hypothetical protein